MMQNVTLTRKERILKERAIVARNRRRKVLGYALAGSVATSLWLSTNAKVLACGDTYVVQKGDNLYSLAKKYGVTVEQLQEANELSSDFIKEGQILEVPLLEEDHAEHKEQKAAKMSVSSKKEKTSSTAKKNTNMVHTVVLGDSLSLIAQKYGVTVKQLQEANELSSDFIKEGQILKIPLLEGDYAKNKEQKATKMSVSSKKEKVSAAKKDTNTVHTVVPGDSLSLIAKKYGVSIGQIQQSNGLTSDVIIVGQKLAIPSKKILVAKKQTVKTNNAKMTYATYTVSPGETLWSIAKKFNISTDTIKAYNNLSSDAVVIGQKLIIKQKNLEKVEATVGGAVDSFSVEFKINGVPTVLQVAYGTASDFERHTGKKVDLVYYKAKRPALVSYTIAK